MKTLLISICILLCYNPNVVKFKVFCIVNKADNKIISVNYKGTLDFTKKKINIYNINETLSFNLDSIRCVQEEHYINCYGKTIDKNKIKSDFNLFVSTSNPDTAILLIEYRTNPILFYITDFH